MIEINLLPPQLRTKKREPINLPSLPVIPVAAGLVILLFAVEAFLLFFIQVKSVSLNSLKKRINSVAASNKEAINVDGMLKEISSKVDMIDKLSGSRFNVARKFNDISDSMVSGVWLRSIAIKKNETPNGSNGSGAVKETLVLEGSSVTSGDSGEAAIGKFINALKENASFSSDFDEIEIAKEERKKLGNTEIMDFVIICHFKKGKGL